MKALTIWQPWATLIMIGAKPFEFRSHDYRCRPGAPQPDTRIVIHAGSRPVHRDEVGELLLKLDRWQGHGELDHLTGLKVEIARELLVKVYAAHSHVPVLPLRCGLGTAILGRPMRPQQYLRGIIPGDSDRLEHCNYAWPLTAIEPFDMPVPARGFQGFWNWQLGQEAA